MIRVIEHWVSARSRREQRLLAAMLLILIPVLVWLAVVMPLTAAYQRALAAQLAAVDRHGRIAALAEAARAAPAPRPPAPVERDLLIGNEARLRGLDAQLAPAPAGTEVSIASAPAGATLAWLGAIEGAGARVTSFQMTPLGNGMVSVKAMVARR